MVVLGKGILTSSGQHYVLLLVKRNNPMTKKGWNLSLLKKKNYSLSVLGRWGAGLIILECFFGV